MLENNQYIGCQQRKQPTAFALGRGWSGHSGEVDRRGTWTLHQTWQSRGGSCWLGQRWAYNQHNNAELCQHHQDLDAELYRTLWQPTLESSMHCSLQESPGLPCNQTWCRQECQGACGQRIRLGSGSYGAWAYLSTGRHILPMRWCTIWRCASQRVHGPLSGCIQDWEHMSCLAACRALMDLWESTQGEWVPAECLSRNEKKATFSFYSSLTIYITDG